MPQRSLYYQAELILPDLLSRAIIAHPDLCIGFIDKAGNMTFERYDELFVKAHKIATGLHNMGLKQGDKAIISSLHNRETIELLWGCFLLGVVPTILQSPMTFSGYNPSAVKLMNVFEHLGRPYIFMSEEVIDLGDLPIERVKHAKGLCCDGTFPAPILKPDDLAFIQFSSGSTGDPKGVMLTHSNLMVNMDAIRIALDIHLPDRQGNWMPLFHDMGLIGYHLVPIYCMIDQYQIETIDFIMNPTLWLNLMSQQKITISGCTNFGLILVLRYLARKKPVTEWDFSSMKALLNGAEPISVKIMMDFIKALQPFGFPIEAMMPVYGMAEATLAVSFAPLLQPAKMNAFDAILLDRDRKAQPITASGAIERLLSEVGVALNDIEIRIVDDGDIPLEDGSAGHIQLKGLGITSGYYNNPQASASVFCDGWLRTGDMGFFFEGRLYISGRYKDIIFKHGRNHFANDLETMACKLDEIKFGKVCFGGTTNHETGQDKVIVFIAGLHEEQAKATFLELQALFASTICIHIDEMILIKSNEIPKTSSGKLQRYKLMQRYINGEFDLIKLLD